MDLSVRTKEEVGTELVNNQPKRGTKQACAQWRTKHEPTDGMRLGRQGAGRTKGSLATAEYEILENKGVRLEDRKSGSIRAKNGVAPARAPEGEDRGY